MCMLWIVMHSVTLCNIILRSLHYGCAVHYSQGAPYSVTPVQISVLLAGTAGPFTTAAQGIWGSREGLRGFFLYLCGEQGERRGVWISYFQKD